MLNYRIINTEKNSPQLIGDVQTTTELGVFMEQQLIPEWHPRHYAS